MAGNVNVERMHINPESNEAAKQLTENIIKNAVDKKLQSKKIKKKEPSMTMNAKKDIRAMIKKGSPSLTYKQVNVQLKKKYPSKYLKKYKKSLKAYAAKEAEKNLENILEL